MLASKLLSTVGASEEPLYSSDVFSTYLYTGNGGTQTINNGIDLAGKGGMVWFKGRQGTGYDNALYDSARGFGSGYLSTNSTGAQSGALSGNTFLSDGLSFGTNFGLTNNNAIPYVNWTFRKAPKFFDVVTYTGNGVAGRQIPHSLGIAPGMVIVKKVDGTAADWRVWHRSVNTKFLVLNTTAAADDTFAAQKFGNGTITVNPTSTQFTVGADGGVNLNSATYVAYLFAHDPSADGIIQCGSYVGNGSTTGPTITLGWEPQYLLIKRTDSAANWYVTDAMRGLTTKGGLTPGLNPNLSSAEDTGWSGAYPTATGFEISSTNAQLNASGGTYIYLAIRRPNKPPTTGAQVYNAIARTGTGAATTVTGVGFASDLVIMRQRDSANNWITLDRLRDNKLLIPNTAEAESVDNTAIPVNAWDRMDGVDLGGTSSVNNTSAATYINHFFRRAPGFFDVVCYTGTGVAGLQVTHALGTVPGLVIVKCRSATSDWYVGYFNGGASPASEMRLNTTAVSSVSLWSSGASANKITITYPGDVGGLSLNTPSATYVAYLFASLPGISKVGSYTGNGGSQTINCGFTTGARFILIKKTSGTGDWLVADTARGVVSAGDPRLSLNTTAAEVTGEDWLDPDATGFIINQTTADANASGASYIFLAIA